MIVSNFHMHCNFCDGLEKPEAYVEEALRKGFKAIGFSSHAPIPFENDWTMREGRIEEYFDAIAELKLKYSGRIEIYTGLEVDYFDGEGGDMIKKYKTDERVDYVIGSVHFFTRKGQNYYYSIDGSSEDFRKTLNECFNGDIKEFVSSYYGHVAKMLKEQRPCILGHLDIVKKNNFESIYFSEEAPWYRELVYDALSAAKECGTIVEVNTGGITRGYIKETYPSGWILKKYREMDIPVIITSDAHAPENIDGCFNAVVSMLKNIGYREQMTLSNSRWIKVPL